MGISSSAPNLLYFGSDHFTFTVTDGQANSTGRAEITVTWVNNPPQAVDHSASNT